VKFFLFYFLFFVALEAKSQNAHFFSENNLYGLAIGDSIITAPKYNYCWKFKNGMAMVNVGGDLGFDDGIYGGYFGFVDTIGREIIPLIYSNLSLFDSTGISIACLNKKFGAINTRGNTIIPFKFDLMHPFSDNLALVNLGFKGYTTGGHDVVIEYGKFGYVDRSGKIVIELKYDHAESFHNGRARVSSILNDETTADYIIDVHGNQIKE
jgi:hypothetical protein